MSNKSIVGGAGEGAPMTKAELEEERRKFKELCSTPIPDAPPKSRAIAVAVDAQTAENARARPESIRIATRDGSGATRLSAPRRYSVDAGGSSAVGWIGWGPSGTLGTGRVWFDPDDPGTERVQHRYNPLDALKNEDDR
jgi:hypothetical protein